MPEEEKVKKSEIAVDIDTSGPEIDVAVPEEKEEAVVETKEQEPTVTEVKEVKDETVKDIKKEQKEDDSKLEDYSKGVQSRLSLIHI